MDGTAKSIQPKCEDAIKPKIEGGKKKKIQAKIHRGKKVQLLKHV